QIPGKKDSSNGGTIDFGDEKDNLLEWDEEYSLRMRASCCQGISFTPFSNVITFNTPIPTRFKSKILTKQENDLLLSFLPKGKREVTLLYCGSSDGFGADIFHEKCDYAGATVTIVLSDQFNHVFGGFTNLQWTSRNTYANDAGAFVYLLRSGKGDNPQKFTIKSGYEGYAIYDNSSYGPAFGKKVKNEKIGLITIFMFKCGGHDFYISDYCNSTTNNYCKPHSYNGPSDNTRLAGANNFKVKEIEVYLVEWHDFWSDLAAFVDGNSLLFIHRYSAQLLKLVTNARFNIEKMKENV
ncbi:hypothetical protein RFI_37941, partial [Reticulomyxa filosa]